MWIDIHAHLYDYTDDELRAIITEAHDADVDYILSTAVSIATSAVVLHQCDKNNEIFGAVGISPFDVLSLGNSWLSDLSSLLCHKKILAIGEIGLDDSNPTYPPLVKQTPIFEKQLELAVSNNLPVIIHSRGIEMHTVETCLKQGVKKALFHCFTGDKESLEAIVQNGYMVSISGIVTFNKSNLQELIRHIPLSQLFIETDSPYLTPVPHRGKKNTPAMVGIIGEKIAEILNISLTFLQEHLRENFKNFFLNKIV
jgi:TatD DNase family protein